MKIRLGFVSNSSSSSFLIYGFSIESYELNKSVCPENDNEDEDGDQDENAYEKIEEIMGKYKDLDFYSPGEFDTYYIGRSWGNVGDYETGKQFKENVKADIKKLCEELKIEMPELSTLEESWMS